MSTNTDDDPFADTAFEPAREPTRADCQHTLIDEDDAPPELAIFSPTSAFGDFEWVVATGDESFVDLETVR